MTSRYVKLGILTSGDDKAKATLDDLAERARALGNADPTISPSVNDTEAEAKLKDLKLKLDILNRYKVGMSADLNDDKAQAKLLDISSKLRDVSKITARPNISLRDADKAEASLLKIKLLLDALPDRKSVRVDVHESDSLIGRIRSHANIGKVEFLKAFGLSALGGEGGKGGGDVGGENAAAGLFNGSPGAFLTSPTGAGLLTSIASLLPSLTGFGAGLGVAGGGAALAALFAKQSATAIKNDQQALAAAKTKAQKAAAEAQLKADTKADAPFINLTSGVQGLEQPLMQAITPFVGRGGHMQKVQVPGALGAQDKVMEKWVGPTGLIGIVDQFGKWLDKISPELSKMFTASLPFATAFMHIMEQGAMQLFPALLSAMLEIKPQLPEMVKGFVLLIKALADFIQVMGPEMKDSVTIFVGVCKGLQVTMNILGLAIDYVTGTLKLAGDWVKIMAHLVGDLFTGNLKGAWNAVKDFGHSVAGVFDNLRRATAEALDNMGLAKFGHDCARIFDGIRHDVSSAWDDTWKNTVGRFEQFYTWDTQKMGSLRHDISQAFDGIRHDVASVWDSLWSEVESKFQYQYDWINQKVDNLRHNVTSGFDGLRHDVTSIWDTLWGDITSTTSTAISKLGSVLNRIENAFNKPFAWVGDHVLHPLSNVWNWIAGHTGNILPKMPTTFNLADGGFVNYGSGPRADDVPAMLSRGEVVVPAHMVSGGAVDHLRGVLPGFANGGVAGNSGDSPGRSSAMNKEGTPNGGNGWLGSIGNAIGAAASSVASFISGIPSDLGGIGRDIAKGAAVPATHAAEALINGTLGKTPAMMTGAARAMGDLMIGRMASAMATTVAAQSGNGASIVKFAEKFIGKLPYVWGGTSLTSGADCSGFVQSLYKHFGYNIPRTSEEQFAGMARITSPAPGDLVFFVGEGDGGTRSSPGHVGLYTGFGGNRAMIDEPFTGQKARYDDISGNVGFRGPRGGFMGSGSVGAVGAGYVNIGKGLMREGFGRAAAAGIVGDIAGESGGNPESVGSGGGGLIGWTPISSAYPNKIITGNRARDMTAQIEDIKAYVQRNGSLGDMNRYKDPVQAAYHFSSQYERPRITYSDVRPSVARSTYAALDNGIGWLAPGINMIYNGLGHMEPMADPSRYPSRFGGGAGGAATYIVINNHGVGNMSDKDAEKLVQSINARARHNGGKTGLISS